MQLFILGVFDCDYCIITCPGGSVVIYFFFLLFLIFFFGLTKGRLDEAYSVPGWRWSFVSLGGARSACSSGSLLWSLCLVRVREAMVLGRGLWVMWASHLVFVRLCLRLRHAGGLGEVPIYAWICLSLVAWVMRDSELAFALVRLEGVDEWIDHGHVRALRFGWSLCVGDVLLMCDASLLVGCFRVESGVVRFRVSLLSRQLVNSRSCLTLFALRQCI